jgi:hypothetical protein
VPLAVDPARRELAEPLAHGYPEQRGDRRRQHRQPEQGLLVTGRRPPEPEHDQQVRRRDHRREAGHGDGVHQQPVDAHREALRRSERERQRDEHRGRQHHRAQVVGPREELVQHPRAQ